MKGHLQPAKKITAGHVVDIGVSRAFTSEGNCLEYNLPACGYTQAVKNLGKRVFSDNLPASFIKM